MITSAIAKASENLRGRDYEKSHRRLFKLAIATREYVKTVSVSFPANAAPIPAMLCIYENSIFDTMGMLCRFLCLRYGAIHSSGYLG